MKMKDLIVGKEYHSRSVYRCRVLKTGMRDGTKSGRELYCTVEKLTPDGESTCQHIDVACATIDMPWEDYEKNHKCNDDVLDKLLDVVEAANVAFEEPHYVLYLTKEQALSLCAALVGKP